MEARQSRLVREKQRFFDFNWLPWQCRLKNQKKLNGVNEPSTNPEILVKIGPLGSHQQHEISNIIYIFSIITHNFQKKVPLYSCICTDYEVNLSEKKYNN